MANLTPEQLDAVSQWAEEGANLNDVQRRLKEQFDLTITYMDARLLLIDVGVRLKDKPREAPPAPAPAQVPDPTPAADAAADLPADADDAASPAPAGDGNVTLVVDAVTVPGTMVSGKVTFSDGQTAGWYVDQTGRLGMRAPSPGYTPPPADIPIFQNELDRVLMQQGF
jgi:hypothetical protein